MKHNFGKNNKEFNYSLNRENNDDKTGILKFSKCDDKFPMYDLNKEELKEFISFAKSFEKLQWRNILTYNGLNFEPIPELKKPDSISKDITLYSMRISQKFRIIGYRQEDQFYIVWFDKNHNAYKG